MQLTIKLNNREKGFIELVLLTFLAIILIQINSLWTLSKLKLWQEKISYEVLKEDRDRKVRLFKLLQTDPALISVPNLNTGLKSAFKSPYLDTNFFVADKGPILNWLFYDSQNIGVLACPNATENLCSLDKYFFTTSKVAIYTETLIGELSVNTNIDHPAMISLGNLTIENLILNPISVPKFRYLLISSYNNIKIDRISGALPNGTKLLLYSALGEISVLDTGINRPCDNTGVGALVFIGPSVNIAGKNRKDLRFSNKTCLKDFPNQIFTSIKIATIH